MNQQLPLKVLLILELLKFKYKLIHNNIMQERDLITSHPSIAGDAHVIPGQTLCHKNIGKKQKLRKGSRGHQFIIRGGGHIDSWQPLFQ